MVSWEKSSCAAKTFSRATTKTMKQPQLRFAMAGFTQETLVTAMLDGFFYIVDRKSDMIIRGGENIYPREIDEVLYQHPAVASAATIGIPDQLYGEEVAAFIVLKKGTEVAEEELISFCRERLADFKCPKSIHFVEEIPKGPTGKLLKRELSQQFMKK